MNEHKIYFIDTENRKHKIKERLKTVFLYVLFIAFIIITCLIATYLNQ